jgi:hypothetical protein
MTSRLDLGQRERCRRVKAGTLITVAMVLTASLGSISYDCGDTIQQIA